MAKSKQISNEREYIIPLRREILKVPRHKRTPKAVKAIKQFVAKHMRIPDRDVSKVKIDKYLNQELWFRGIKNPPTKIKVKVTRDKENILVSLVELPNKLKFKKEKEDKKIEASKKIKKDKEKTEKPETKKEEKTEEQKSEEKEKAETSAEAKELKAEAQAKENKHIKKQVSPKAEHRKALKK